MSEFVTCLKITSLTLLYVLAFNERCLIHSSLIHNIIHIPHIFPTLNLERSRETLHRFISFADYEEKNCPLVFKSTKYIYCRQREIKKVFRNSFLNILFTFLLFLFLFLFFTFCCYYPFFHAFKNPTPSPPCNRPFGKVL